jgi:hypothetical protein
VLQVQVINTKVAPNILFYLLAKSHNFMSPLGISFYLITISVLMKKIKEKSEILFSFHTRPGPLTQPVTRLPETHIVAMPHRQSPLSHVSPHVSPLLSSPISPLRPAHASFLRCPAQRVVNPASTRIATSLPSALLYA